VKRRPVDRGLPESVDAERAVLGAIFLDGRNPNECLLQAAEKLEADDFSLDSHRRIFGAILAVNEDQKPIDFITVPEKLRERGELEVVGGNQYVTNLTDGQIRRQNIEYHIEILLKHSGQRRLIHLASSAIQKAYGLEDPSEIIGGLNEGMNDISQRSTEDTLLPVSKIMPRVVAEMQAEFERNQDFIGLPTGIGELNYFLAGLVAKENIVVAADPGGGKTAFALNVAEVNCLRDTPVSIFSLEMSDKALLLRLAARRTGIPQWKIRNTKKLSHVEKVAILEELAEIMRWPLWIDDTSSLTPRQLYSRARMAASKGTKLTILDYLQLMNAPGRDLREQTSNSSKACKATAKDSGTAMLTLSQLTRPQDKGIKGMQRKPTMHDLRESGSIEADADSIVFLWRDWQEDAARKIISTGNDAFILGKNRNGPVTEIPATFDAPFMEWRSRGNAVLPEDHKAAGAGA